MQNGLTTERKSEFIVDEALAIEATAVARDNSYIKFSKLKTKYDLNWFFSVRVTRLNRQTTVAEEEPTTVADQASQLLFKSKNRKLYAQTGTSSETNGSQVSKARLPTEIPVSSPKSAKKLFFSEDCSPARTSPVISWSSSQSPVSQNLRSASKPKFESTGKTPKRLKKNLLAVPDENALLNVSDGSVGAQPKIDDVFVSNRPKISRVLKSTAIEESVKDSSSKRKIVENGDKILKKKKAKGPGSETTSKKQPTDRTDIFDALDEDNMKKIEEFVENFRNREEQQRERRQELAKTTFEDCTDLKNDELRK